MRRRILLSTLTVVVTVALLLGVPLMFTAWRLVEDIFRSDLKQRLELMGDEVRAQEGPAGRIDGSLQTEPLRLAVPAGGRLEVVYPSRLDNASTASIGEPYVRDAVAESYSMGVAGSLRLLVPSQDMRAAQWRAVLVVALLVSLSIAGGAGVAKFSARRLSDPLSDLANRAARLGAGDFRTHPRRHGIPELDRVSDVLDAASVEIADRLQRERALVGDVSHQLRSRLTAIRLRLDELSTHPDPGVVEEATEALSQVDRLTSAVEEMVRASQHKDLASIEPIDVLDELSQVVRDWQKPFQEADRTLKLRGPAGLKARATSSRLREAVSVLVDNALKHGAGTCAISVRRVGGSSRDSMVCVEVSDEGAGVGDDLAPHVFDRGFSGVGSSGVGLALARALVEADGGRMDLQRRKPPVFSVFVHSEEGGWHPPTPRREPR